MWRAWAAAIVALAALLGVLLAGCGSGSAPGRTGIAYVTGAGQGSSVVWLAAPDGSGAHRLGPGSEPLLSPSGSLVAASSPSARGPALTIYTSTGSTLRMFFSTALVTAAAQAWSPDSRYLAVVLQSANPVTDAHSGLAIIDTRTLQARLVAKGSIYGASFAPEGGDRVAFGVARTSALAARIDIEIRSVDGSGAVTVTRDGRSLNPVWGRTGIAFDHERLRERAAPAYQVWLMQPDGSGRRALTHKRPAALLNGLVPVAFSADGTRLLVEDEGAETSQAWTVEIGGHSVWGGGISRDGQQLLVDLGGFLNPPRAGTVESVPFGGGGAKALVAHGSSPSWNQ